MYGGSKDMEMVAEAKLLIVHQVCERCGEGIMQLAIEVKVFYPKSQAESCAVCYDNITVPLWCQAGTCA